MRLRPGTLTFHLESGWRSHAKVAKNAKGFCKRSPPLSIKSEEGDAAAILTVRIGGKDPIRPTLRPLRPLRETLRLRDSGQGISLRPSVSADHKKTRPPFGKPGFLKSEKAYFFFAALAAFDLVLVAAAFAPPDFLVLAATGFSPPATRVFRRLFLRAAAFL